MDAVGLIGFGEAGSGFAGAFAPAVRERLRVFDRRPERSGVAAIGEAVGEAAFVLSLVTADQAVAAAMAAAPYMREGALWLDMNSVAPGTKRQAAAIMAAVGARYVDVAVMAPVHPALLHVPLLLAGQAAEDGLAALQSLGFGGRVVAGGVGAAAAIKMIRSIAIKGFEAVTAECVLAATAAGVAAEVFGSIDASDPGLAWPRRAAYSLERMARHGIRRAEEMLEAEKTAQALGLPGMMAGATTAFQRRIGALGAAGDADAAALLALLEEKSA